MKEVAATERLPGLYRGIGPTLLAIAPFMAVQQSSYDILKQQAIKHQLEASVLLFFTCGSVAGGIAQTVSASIAINRYLGSLGLVGCGCDILSKMVEKNRYFRQLM